MDIKQKKPTIKQLQPLLNVTWGYTAFTDSEKESAHASMLDGQYCLAGSDGGYLIIEDGALIGVLLYKHAGGLKWLKNLKNTLAMLWHALYLKLRSKHARRTLKSMVTVQKGYQALLKQSDVTTKDEVVLFITSPHHQGKGLGKKLMTAYQSDLKKQGKVSFYLFTDTSCNFGFYDHLGFVQKGSKTVNQYLKDGVETETLFIYEKHLD